MSLAIQCEDLPNPVNGEIFFTSDDTAPFDFGTLAVYSCNAGFGLSGYEQRTCGGDGDSTMGEWSGGAPSCAGITARSIKCISDLEMSSDLVYVVTIIIIVIYFLHCSNVRT